MDSELILNSDGSVYHLNLLPDDVADTIFFVGDPHRVKQVSKYFDRVDIQKTKREFITHTGSIGKQRFTVIGTGMGSGNIDIVMNELDALVNIDFQTRTIKKQLKKLRIIRLGTSGALSAHIPVDQILITTYSIGLDGLVTYYDWQNNISEKKLAEVARSAFSQSPFTNTLYVAKSDPTLCQLFSRKIAFSGITLTCPGFYGAQHRQLRAPLLHHYNVITLAEKIQFEQLTVTNLEMETAAICALARILNHDACSINAIIANRYTQTFSKNPDKIVDDMIQAALEVITLS